MKIKSTDFQVSPGDEFTLSDWPTKVKPLFNSKKQYHKRLDEGVEELSELQRLHYASNRYAILLIFQGMDAAGKNGCGSSISVRRGTAGLFFVGPPLVQTTMILRT